MLHRLLKIFPQRTLKPGNEIYVGMGYHLDIICCLLQDLLKINQGDEFHKKKLVENLKIALAENNFFWCNN